MVEEDNPSGRSAAPIAPAVATAVVATAALAGVVRGGAGVVKPPAPAGSSGVVVTGQGPTDTEASRFLQQATMGATGASVAEVMTKGFEGWLTAQFAMPRPSSLWDDLVARGQSDFANIHSTSGYDPAVWRQLITGPDQLRMRVGTALLDWLVVGMPGLTTLWIQFHCAAYLDTLMDGAFGTYRALLERITFHPAMAAYLSSLNNKKANPTTGAQPDENFAREIMQLFTIGLHQLNMDGSVRTSGGVPLETYTQSDVTQLARIFTGIMHPDGNWHTHEYARKTLTIEPAWNESGASTFLGRTISGGGVAAMRAALDHLCAHPNMPPFIARQLIQRLVTSNPSPGYILRVATVFADNGAGVRGDLKAVVKAILLDIEARGAATLASNTAGRLRPPVQRLTAWARAFGATSPSNRWAIGNTASASGGIGQSTGQAPSVFNFFRPGYSPPGQVAAQKLVAPEFQMANEQSVVSYVNVMQRLVGDGIDDVKAPYQSLAGKAGNTAALVDEVNLLLTARQLSAGSVATITAAVDGASGAAQRIWTAVLLTLAAPEFLVTR